MFLNLGNRSIDLSSPKIMGVINMTPDSFSDGGRFRTIKDALLACEEMRDEGASIIDIGGESTRPGSEKVSTQTQIDRVIPLIQAIKKNMDIVLSIDSGDPKVIKEAINNGVEIVNDVYALKNKGSIDVVCKERKAVCLMHMKGKPLTMQIDPTYKKLPEDVVDFLEDRVNVCIAAGINKNQIFVDPGFGFGKTLQHNLLILKFLNAFKKIGVPICVGVSRKKFIGDITNKPIGERSPGSLMAAMIAVQNGASIIRTHDVAATKGALEVASALDLVESI
ncbi:MAG: dihydropteroate synthase [Pseudomonadota bacterium]|nr:dihydropteroate synthase [Pseudomonadota bacterium]